MQASNRRTAILVSIAMFTASCGGGAPPEGDAAATRTDPSDTAQHQDSSRNDDAPAAAPAPVNGEPATIDIVDDETAATSATLDAAGGEITVEYEGVTMTLQVPPGALVDPMEITLTPVSDATSRVLDSWTGGVEFAPAGLGFAVPAVLELRGATIGPELRFVEWDESGGEVYPSIPQAAQSGHVELPVAHFSGAGGGAGNGETWSPSQRSVIQILHDAVVAMVEATEAEEEERDGMTCVDADSPAGQEAFAIYQQEAREQIFPLIEATAQDDLSLLPATRAFLSWWSVPQLAASLACPDLVEKMTEMPEAEILSDWLRAGYVHALHEADRQCRSNRDPGEVKHITDWVGRTQTLVSFPTFEEEDWSGIAQPMIEACLRYNIELRSDLTLAADSGEIRGTISAQASDVPHSASGQLMGFDGSDDPTFPFSHASSLQFPSGNSCTTQDGTSIEDLTGRWLEITVPEPKRRIPGLDSATAPPDPPGEGGDEPGGRLVIDTLEGHGSLTVKCGDIQMTMPHIQDLTPMWFNAAARAANPVSADQNPGMDTLTFHLEAETGTSLVASYRDTKPIVDPTDPSATVEQETEIKVFHAPTSSGLTEPALPPRPDWAG